MVPSCTWAESTMTTHYSVDCRRCDGFCTGAGLWNKVRKRQRDGCRLSGLEGRERGRLLPSSLWYSSGLSPILYPILPPSLSSSLLIPHGMGLAARIQEREKGRKGMTFSILSPPGKDWPSNSRGRKIVRRFPLFCSLSAGALQRGVLRGGEDQR